MKQVFRAHRLCKQDGPLGPYIESYDAEMRGEGYAQQTREVQTRLVADFGCWLAKRGIHARNITAELFRPYLRARARSRRPTRNDLSALQRLLELLRRQEVVAAAALPATTPAERLQSEFRLYLRQERALASTTQAAYTAFVSEFLTERFGAGSVDLSRLCAADVTRFVRRRASTIQSKRVQLMTTALRSFLRFARYRGDILDLLLIQDIACVAVPCAQETARQQLLVKEKALTRSRDALAAERRRMPWMAVEKNYEFDGPKGKVSLLDLFEGRPQLIVYRAFFEPGVFGWPEHACRGCSLGADQVANLAHLNARNTTLVYASRAPQVDIARLKARMGWEMPWYTMTDSFDKDFGVDEWHGHNVFFPTATRWAHIRKGDAIAALRRRLPMVAVDGNTPLIGRNNLKASKISVPTDLPPPSGLA